MVETRSSYVGSHKTPKLSYTFTWSKNGARDAETPWECWSLFFADHVIQQIVDCTIGIICLKFELFYVKWTANLLIFTRYMLYLVFFTWLVLKWAYDCWWTMEQRWYCFRMLGCYNGCKGKFINCCKLLRNSQVGEYVRIDGIFHDPRGRCKFRPINS